MKEPGNSVAAQLAISSRSVQETQRLGQRVGELAQAGDVLALEGELGAGKTNFAQGLAKGLGVTEVVNSPTFILANEYLSGRIPLYHIDAYRVQDASEARGFGLDDYLLGDGVTVVEWADRVNEALPEDTLVVRLEYVGENERSIRLIPMGPRASLIATALERGDST
jgi:tRNA threonylcarbamoyladenosine biosynthesis protein TsaE